MRAETVANALMFLDIQTRPDGKQTLFRRLTFLTSNAARSDCLGTGATANGLAKSGTATSNISIATNNVGTATSTAANATSNAANATSNAANATNSVSPATNNV
jgi:hypothetical protein